MQTYAKVDLSQYDAALDLSLLRQSQTYKRVYPICSETVAWGKSQYTLAAALEVPSIPLSALTGDTYLIEQKLSQDYLASMLLEHDIKHPGYEQALNDCGYNDEQKFMFMLNLFAINSFGAVFSVSAILLAAKKVAGIMKKRKDSGTRLKDRYPKTIRTIFWLSTGIVAYELGKKIACGNLLSNPAELQPEANTLPPEDIVNNIMSESGFDLGAMKQARTDLINAHIDDIDDQLETLDPESDDYKKLSEQKSTLLELAEL